MFETEIFRKQIYCIEKSTCNIFGSFRRPSSDSAPMELFPPCTPRYTPERTLCLWTIFVSCLAKKQHLDESVFGKNLTLCSLISRFLSKVTKFATEKRYSIKIKTTWYFFHRKFAVIDSVY